MSLVSKLSTSSTRLSSWKQPQKASSHLAILPWQVQANLLVNSGIRVIFPFIWFPPYILCLRPSIGLVPWPWLARSSHDALAPQHIRLVNYVLHYFVALSPSQPSRYLHQHRYPAISHSSSTPRSQRSRGGQCLAPTWEL